MKIFLYLSFIFALPSLACEAVDKQSFEKVLKEKPMKRVVFFASWCASCKKHLQTYSIVDSIFVAAFDEKEAATKAFKQIQGPYSKCYFDAKGEIIKKYKVKGLPKIVSL